MAKRKGVLKEISAKKGPFAIVFVILFGITFGFLALVGATPDAPGTTKDSDLLLNSNTQTIVQPAVITQGNTAPVQTTPTQTAPTQTSTQQGTLPTRITIKKLGLDVTIANPNTTNVETLDKYLLKGAVRYPTSGYLGENGTVLLFGHSSYLPVVHNQAYKAFDGIQDLKPGDIIIIYAGISEYHFSVTSERVANAENDIVELPQDGQHLTLVTCDSFASKSHRFVVTADLVSS